MNRAACSRSVKEAPLWFRSGEVLFFAYELRRSAGRRFDLEPQDAKTHWAITPVHGTPKEFPLAEPQYVMSDCGPLLFDRQKDAVRRTSELGQSYWEVVKVRWGKDGKLRRAFR